MTKKIYDLVVIGSGPAARRAAIQASKFGKNVLVVENDKFGGVSIHTGTIPSKTIRETVLNLTGYRERNFYKNYTNNISAKKLFKRFDITKKREVLILEDQFLRNQVDIIKGIASFKNKNEILIEQINSEPILIYADKFIIAVGTRCYRPNNINFDGKFICDSDQFLKINTIPKNITIVGAGVIGIEYASILNILGKKITIIDPRTDFLEFIDREIILSFKKILSTKGVKFKLGTKLTSISKIKNKKIYFELDNNEKLNTDLILFTAGRVGSTEKLELKNTKIEVDNRGRISVNKSTFQTQQPNIYAVGDVIGFPALASTSMAQGRIAACHACGKKIYKLNNFFPYGIYSIPEISTSGSNEEELVRKKIPYVKGIGLFKETSRGQIMGVDYGYLKLLFHKKNKKLLGVHIIGEGSAELVHIGQAVLQFDGGLDYFIKNIFNFPTLAEAYKVASLNALNQINDISIEDLS
ncbi:Si-specific NAD(P)(+) transhydrogenase [Alphaproteobacteria bacterium]|nr:Si-specific NAD(P)(+) transhydrogenase [Alphaproteobacteria bacterium]